MTAATIDVPPQEEEQNTCHVGLVCYTRVTTVTTTVQKSITVDRAVFSESEAEFPPRVGSSLAGSVSHVGEKLMNLRVYRTTIYNWDSSVSVVLQTELSEVAVSRAATSCIFCFFF